MNKDVLVILVLVVSGLALFIYALSQPGFQLFPAVISGALLGTGLGKFVAGDY